MIIDHVCFAVKNLKEALDYWHQAFGYEQMTQIIENSLQKVLVVFMHKEGSAIIKLIEPVDGNTSLQKFVNKGGGFHHICFRCRDIKTTMDDLNSKGLLILAPPQPGEAFNNHNIAFMLAKYGLNIELIDTTEKAARLINEDITE